MYFLTSDEHFFHRNIIRYSNRPFRDLDEMHEVIIFNHNSVVSKNDITIHAGDFSFGDKTETQKIIDQLNGDHIFTEGSHDYWAKGMKLRQIYEKRIGEDHLVVCHYSFRVWPKSHYGSYHAYGHSHGSLPGIGRSMDVGVDAQKYFPISFEDFKNKLRDEKFAVDGRRK